MDSNTLNQAIHYLSKDKLLKELIDKYNKPVFIENENQFFALIPRKTFVSVSKLTIWKAT